jgi:hypothetical protein
MIVIAKRSDHGVSETPSIQIARNIGYDIKELLWMRLESANELVSESA